MPHQFVEVLEVDSSTPFPRVLPVANILNARPAPPLSPQQAAARPKAKEIIWIKVAYPHGVETHKAQHSWGEWKQALNILADQPDRGVYSLIDGH